MQTPINFSKKYITVAKDSKAMEALNYDRAQSEQLWDYLIPQADFAILTTSDIIDNINEICDSMIDDFEDDMISDPQKLAAALSYLQHIQRTPDNEHIVGVLIDMFAKAIDSRTAIYFFF